MSYIDVADISQHFFQSGALAESDIAEFMAEEEYYVKTELDLDPLPPEHPTLKSIIRDLTVARCMLTLVPIQGDVAHAEYLRREALRRLEGLDRGGLAANTPTSGRLPQNEVIPTEDIYAETEHFWTWDDFA